jgi:TonB-linked SusC/RagA family outer membrane protein
MVTRTSLPIGFAGTLCLLLSAPVSGWGQTGTITGVVRNAVTGDPIETAQVHVPDTRIGTLTDPDGNFTLPTVPAGEIELRVEIMGYTRVTETVVVVAGETLVLEFELEPSILRLQELIVTGTATRIPRAKLPFSVERLDAADMPVPATSAELQVRAKAAGVRVVRGSGQPGDEASVMLRSPTTIMGGQGPLVLIDGVPSWVSLAEIDALDIQSIEIVKGAAAAAGYGSAAANGIIHIITKRGASLEAGASQFTLRSEVGFQSLGGDFPLVQQHPYQMNADGTSFVNAAGEDIPYGSGLVQDTIYTPDPDLPAPPGTDGYGGDLAFVTFQDKDYPPPTYNQIDRFFDPGALVSLNAAVTGKTNQTSYRASFSNLREKGIILFHDGYTRRNARLNIDHQVWDNLTLSLGGYYAWSRQDNVYALNNALFDLSFMPPHVDLLERECLEPQGAAPADCEVFGDLIASPDIMNVEEDNPLWTLENSIREDRRSRVMSNLGFGYSPFHWLDIEGGFSFERDDWHRTVYMSPDKEMKRPWCQVEGRCIYPGYSERDNEVSQSAGAGLVVSLNRQLGDFILRGHAGYGFEKRSFELLEAWGSGLGAAEVPVLDLTDPITRDVATRTENIAGEGFALIAALDYKGKYIFDGVVRWDGSSLFGADQRWQNYYRGSVAWRLAQEPWWFVDAFDEFKIRYSYGTAGSLPAWEAQYETYEATLGGIFPENLGNKEIRPEFVTEQELGLELLVFDRLNAVINYSDQRTEDALLLGPLPGFAGYQSHYTNAGSIKGNTWELSLEAALAETRDLSWTARLTWDRTRQRITELGIPPYRDGGYGEFFVRAGDPLLTYYGDRWATSCADLNPLVQDFCDTEFQVNDDGFLVWVGDGNEYTEGIGNQLWGTTRDLNGFSFDWGMPIKALECQRRLVGGHFTNLPPIECDADADGVVDEVPEGAGFTSQAFTETIRIGDTMPDFAWSLSSSLRWKGLTLYFLFDSEVGHDVYFRTAQWAMREGNSAYIDQRNKPDELKKPIKYYSEFYNVNQENSFFIHDGSYVKLRELALGYTFNGDQLRPLLGFLNIQGATLRLIGRNLLTFTDYPGYDPEVSEGTGGSDVIGRTDAYSYPNFRTISATLELTF